jgi:hypothetical protein
VRAWLLLGLLGIAGVALRTVVAGRAAVDAGERALAAGDQVGAVHAFVRAVRAHVPATASGGRAVAQLRGLAERAAAAGDGAGEERALLALRAGILGVQPFAGSFAPDLAWADQRLAFRYAAMGTRAPVAWHLARLERPAGTRPGGTAALLLGFGLWLGAALLFARRGLVSSFGRVAVRPGWAIVCGGGFVLGVTLFVSSVWLV